MVNIRDHAMSESEVLSLFYRTLLQFRVAVILEILLVRQEVPLDMAVLQAMLRPDAAYLNAEWVVFCREQR